MPVPVARMTRPARIVPWSVRTPVACPFVSVTAETVADDLGPRGGDQGAGEVSGVGDALFGEEERAVGHRAESGEAFGDLRARQPLDPVAEGQKIAGGFLLGGPGRLVPEAALPCGWQAGKGVGQAPMGGKAFVAEVVVGMREKERGIEPAKRGRRGEATLGMGGDDGDIIAPAGKLVGKRRPGYPGTDDESLGHRERLAWRGLLGNGRPLGQGPGDADPVEQALRRPLPVQP